MPVTRSFKKVSGANLAGAVANAGGIGLISSFGIGLNSPYFDTKPKRFFEANKLALIDELAKARAISPDGIVGVNVLVATRDYQALAETAAAHGANLIVTGAGMPLTLPEYVRDYPTVALVPIISNSNLLRQFVRLGTKIINVLLMRLFWNIAS